MDTKKKYVEPRVTKRDVVKTRKHVPSEWYKAILKRRKEASK